MLSLILLLLAAVLPLTSAVLSPEEIQAALAEKKALLFVAQRSQGWAYPPVIVGFVSTPYSRLTWVAQNARERFEPVAPADVAAAIADPRLCVSTPSSTNVVQSLVLIPHNVKAITPATIIRGEESTAIQEVYNRLGGRWKEASYTACFPDGWQTQALDVVVVYQGDTPTRVPLPSKLR